MKTASKKGILPVPVLLKLVNLIDKVFFKKTLSSWPPFMDGIQLPQGYSHFKEAPNFLPLSSHDT